MLGYPEEELLRMGWGQLTHPDDLGPSLQMAQRLLSGASRIEELEKRYLHRSGNVVWALTRVSLARDGSGAPLYFVTHLEDIGERMRAAAAMRQSEEQYRSLIANIPDVVWTVGRRSEVHVHQSERRKTAGLSRRRILRARHQLCGRKRSTRMMPHGYAPPLTHC